MTQNCELISIIEPETGPHTHRYSKTCIIRAVPTSLKRILKLKVSLVSDVTFTEDQGIVIEFLGAT